MHDRNLASSLCSDIRARPLRSFPEQDDYRPSLRIKDLVFLDGLNHQGSALSTRRSDQDRSMLSDQTEPGTRFPGIAASTSRLARSVSDYCGRQAKPLPRKRRGQGSRSTGAASHTARGNDHVRGQFSPRVELWAADPVLTKQRQIGQVHGAARMGQLPAGQRDALTNIGWPSTSTATTPLVALVDPLWTPRASGSRTACAALRAPRRAGGRTGPCPR